MLNANQRSFLRITFQTVDESLRRVLAVLDSTQEQSPFSRFVPDATPAQRQDVTDCVTRVRSAMMRALEAQGISLPRAETSSVWSARMAIVASSIALEDVRPKRLRGFGEVSPEDAHALDLVLSEIKELLERMEAYLAQEHGATTG